MKDARKKISAHLMKLNTNTFLTLMISILTIFLEPLPQHYRPSHYGQYERRRA